MAHFAHPGTWLVVSGMHAGVKQLITTTVNILLLLRVVNSPLWDQAWVCTLASIVENTTGMLQRSAFTQQGTV